MGIDSISSRRAIYSVLLKIMKNHPDFRGHDSDARAIKMDI